MNIKVAFFKNNYIFLVKNNLKCLKFEFFKLNLKKKTKTMGQVGNNNSNSNKSM